MKTLIEKVKPKFNPIRVSITLENESEVSSVVSYFRKHDKLKSVAKQLQHYDNQSIIDDALGGLDSMASVNTFNETPISCENGNSAELTTEDEPVIGTLSEEYMEARARNFQLEEHPVQIVETLDDNIKDADLEVTPDPQLIDDVLQSLGGYSHTTTDNISNIVKGSLAKVKSKMTEPPKGQTELTPPDGYSGAGRLNTNTEHSDWDI